MKMHKGLHKILFLAVAIFIFSFGFSAPSYAEEGFEIKTNIGFNGFYKYEYETPVKIEIKNNLRDINGKVQLLFENSNPYGKKIYTAYTKDLDLAKGATKTIDMEILINNYVSDFVIKVLDNNNKVLWENKSEHMPSAKATNTVGIGILSDDIDTLRYLSLMKFATTNEKENARSTSISEIDGLITGNSTILNMFDIILINDYNTENLSDLQKTSLQTWIENGGILLIGTGSNYNKTLKGLDDINFINVKGTSSITEFKNLKDANGKVFNPTSSLPIIEASSDSDNIVLEEENQAIIFSNKIGDGKVVITAFDLGLSPFVDWEGRNQLLEKTIVDDISNSNLSTDINANRNNSNNFSYLNQYVPSSRVPSVKTIIIILLIFTVIVGPINYLVLKKLDKRELAWITIPSLAVLVSMIILIWGMGVSFKNPLMNNISIVNFNENLNKVDINTFSGVIGFKNGDLDIKTGENTDMSIGMYLNRVDYMKFSDNDIILEYILEKDKTISFKNKGIWDVQQIVLNESKSLDKGIVQDIKIKNNILTGSIQNNTSINLDDAIIFYGLDFYRVGDIKSSETKEINFNLSSINATKSSINSGRKDFYQVLEAIYPWNNTTGVATKNSDDVLGSNMKREILDGFFSTNNAYSFNNGVFMIAWNTDSLTEDINVNNSKVDRIDRNVIAIPINVTYEKGEVVEIPYGKISPKILEITGLSLEPQNRSFYGQGSVVMSIKADEKIEANKIDINIINGSISSGVNVWILNYKNNQWEEYGSATLSIDENNKSIYYDETYGTKIKIETKERDSFDIPTFSVKGVAK